MRSSTEHLRALANASKVVILTSLTSLLLILVIVDKGMSAIFESLSTVKFWETLLSSMFLTILSINSMKIWYLRMYNMATILYGAP